MLHVEPGLIATVAHGPVLHTGGDFGLEASTVPAALGLFLTAVLLRQAARGQGRHGKLERNRLNFAHVP